MTQSLRLLVDVGNSRIKWNSLSIGTNEFDQPTQAFPWGRETLSSSLDQHWGAVTEFITGVDIANVAGPEVQKVLTQWITSHWKIAPRFAETTPEFGEIKNGYDQHQELGVDRWLAVIAAHQLFPRSSNVVVDCGSAITIDTVMPDGTHLPGPIIPGDNTLYETLMSKSESADNEQEKSDENLQVFVKNTKNAVLSGVNFAATDGLKTIIEETLKSLDSSTELKIIGSGGAAQDVLSLSRLSIASTPATSTTSYDYIYEPDLVLKGLRIFFEKDKFSEIKE